MFQTGGNCTERKDIIFTSSRAECFHYLSSLHPLLPGQGAGVYNELNLFRIIVVYKNEATLLLFVPDQSSTRIVKIFVYCDIAT